MNKNIINQTETEGRHIGGIEITCACKDENGKCGCPKILHMTFTMSRCKKRHFDYKRIKQQLELVFTIADEFNIEDLQITIHIQDKNMINAINMKPNKSVTKEKLCQTIAMIIFDDVMGIKI